MKAEEEIKLTKVESLRAVDEYRKSATFKEEVTKASSYSSKYGYDDCKAKAKELFLNLNLKKIVLWEEEEEEEGEIQKEQAIEVVGEVVLLTIPEEPSIENAAQSIEEVH